MSFEGYSPTLPSNLGMSNGRLVGMEGQWGRWTIGLFIRLDKFGRFSVAKNEILGKALVPQLVDMEWELGPDPMAFPPGMLMLPELKD